MNTNFHDIIICGDALTEMQKLPSESVDLVITSPPYNLRNSTGNGMKHVYVGGKWNAELQKGYDTYSDNLPYDEYIEWQRNCLKEMMRLIPSNGAIFYNHKWRVQNGLIQDRHEILEGFPVRQIIIWRRKGGINFNDTFFLPTYEVIYMIAKSDFRLVKGANAYGDVWEFSQERDNNHPAPFPLELPERIISSTTASVVLDPFMGSGTTAVAARNLKRNYIGIDISRKYCEMAEERLKQCSCDITMY